MRSSEHSSWSQPNRKGSGSLPAWISINTSLKSAFVWCLPSSEWWPIFLYWLQSEPTATQNLNGPALIHLIQLDLPFKALQGARTPEKWRRRRRDCLRGKVPNPSEQEGDECRLCCRKRLSFPNLGLELLCNFAASSSFTIFRCAPLPGFINASLLLFYWSGFNVIDHRGDT